MNEFQGLLHYKNTSGRDFSFMFKGTKYIVKAWRQIDLPEEMYEFLEQKNFSLELDYELIIQEAENELAERNLINSYKG